MDVVEVLRRLGGSGGTSDVTAHTSRRDLLRAVDAGLAVRVRRGRYALPELPEARVAAERLCGAVSGLSAAQQWGMGTVLAPTAVSVTVRPNAHPVPDRLVSLRFAPLETEELQSRLTRPLRTVLDCAASLPFREGLAVGDSALRMGLVAPEELRRAADRYVGRGAPRVRRVAAAADGRAANAFESSVRGTLIDRGLTGFSPQVEVELADGRRVRVDLADEELMMVGEADSFTWHGSRGALVGDCRRYDELVRTRRRVLRVAWEQAMFEEEWVGQVFLDVAAQQRAAGEVSRARNGLARA